MSRVLARETAMKSLYQMEIHNIYETTLAKEDIDVLKDRDYVIEIIETFIKHKKIVDQNISDHLDKWTIDRIAKIDLSILRVAVVEMLFRNDIPAKVSINEAIELGKKYGSDDSSDFINGVLGTIAKERELV